MVRFRSLGCYPLSAAVSSDAADMDALLAEMRTSREFRTRRPADRSGHRTHRWSARSARDISDARGCPPRADLR